jgi:hypothetical protein
MTEFVKEMEHWAAMRQRQTADLMAQWATADEAIDFVISAVGSLQRSIPQNLAPRKFRSGLRCAQESLRRALASFRTPGQERAALPVALEPRVDLTWQQMRTSIDRLMTVISNLRTLPPGCDEQASQYLTRASSHLGRAWAIARDRANVEEIAERRRVDDHRKGKRTLIITARRRKVRSVTRA